MLSGKHLAVLRAGSRSKSTFKARSARLLFSETANPGDPSGSRPGVPGVPSGTSSARQSLGSFRRWGGGGAFDIHGGGMILKFPAHETDRASCAAPATDSRTCVSTTVRPCRHEKMRISGSTLHRSRSAEGRCGIRKYCGSFFLMSHYRVLGGGGCPINYHSSNSSRRTPSPFVFYHGAARRTAGPRRRDRVHGSLPRRHRTMIQHSESHACCSDDSRDQPGEGPGRSARRPR